MQDMYRAFAVTHACPRCGSDPLRPCTRAPGREHRGPRISFHAERIAVASRTWRAMQRIGGEP